MKTKTKQHQVCSSEDRQENLQKINDYINNCLEKNLPIGVNGLANYLQISHCHFSRVFKKVKGIAPCKYILQKKIEVSQVLLKADRYEQVDIALMLGFYDLPHFCKTFKKITGVPPRQFVKDSKK